MRQTIDPQTVSKLAVEGMTAQEIAAKMCHPASSIYAVAYQYKIELKKGKRGGNRKKPVEKPPVQPVNAKMTAEHDAHEKQAIAEIVAKNGGVVPCTSHKMTPIEAMTYKIPLPRGGKVQPYTPEDLVPDLYEALVDYGVGADEMARLFGVTGKRLAEWMAKGGYDGEPQSFTTTETLTAASDDDPACPVFRAHDYCQFSATASRDTTLLEAAERLIDAIHDRDTAQRELDAAQREIEECLKILQEAAR